MTSAIKQPPISGPSMSRSRMSNLIYFNEVDKGGHFAAWEQPQLFSEEIRAAFKSLR
jgi:pimeloyl-ACP methyl ester carboxylesterase